MRLRRGSSNLLVPRSARRKYHIVAFSLLFLTVLAPLLFLAPQGGVFRFNLGSKDLMEAAEKTQHKELRAFEQIERMFPKEVITTIVSSIDDSGPLSLNAERRKDLSSSWVIDKSVKSNVEIKGILANANGVAVQTHTASSGNEESARVSEDSLKVARLTVSDKLLNPVIDNGTVEEKLTPAQYARRRIRMERKVKRLRELTQQDDAATVAKLEKVLAERAKSVGSGSVLNKYSVWRKDNDENSDSLVRLIRDQLIMARVYASLAQSHNRAHILHELKTRIRESQRTLGEATIDADLPRT